MEVHLIRHTPVITNKDICYGQSNVPLAETFLNDVENFKAVLPTDFDAIFCSPLLRCKDLVTALELNHVSFENSLMEMNFGDWENKKWDDLNQHELHHWMSDFVNIKTPNGENLIEMFERIRLFLDHLRLQNYKKVLLVTHAGVIRCIWAYLLGIPLQNIFKINVDYGQQLIIQLSTNPQFDSIKSVH
jgi:alpha-ribazole phosphatase